MKVAIVHDWFVGGGAEKVAHELHKIYPDAVIYTSYCSPQWRKQLSPAKVVTSYMQYWPLSKMRKFLPPLRAIWFSRLDLSGYDLVISSSGAEAKGARAAKSALHINYCHAPTHYYWSRYEDYMKHPGFGPLNPLARLGLWLFAGPMRQWDYKAAQRPDYMVANSNHTKEQVKKYYGRDAVVIHPPVDTRRFKPKGKTNRQGFLVAGRQTPYKRIDLAVEACTKADLPLKVIGDGPDHQKLVKLAGSRVTFHTKVPDSEMPWHFQQAEAFIFPGVDDFGIVAVEALAAGTPVIAYKAGGALDYVEEGRTGTFFDSPTADSLAEALSKFDSGKFKQSEITKKADQFSPEVFSNKFKQYVKGVMN